MKHLKLTKGLSYMGYGITASRRFPDVFVEDEATAAVLLASGYFTEGDGSVTPPQAAPTGTIEALDTMGATKLRAYAKERGLDLSWPKGTAADTIRADIKKSLTKAEEAEEDDGDDPAGQFTTDGDDGFGAPPYTDEDEE